MSEVPAELAGVGWPEDAPEPGACVRIERPEAGLAVVVLDPPHRTLAVLDLPLMRDLGAALDELVADRSVKGVVFTGRTPISFAAGADLDALAGIEATDVALRLARYGQDLFQRIAELKPRTIAAVGGPVPGGAFELSLACDAILLADDPKTRIGLPETRLGILPGWGGCQRLPRRVGVPTALAAILAGKLYPARKAWKMGLVDRLTPPEYLRRIAADLALGRKPVRRKKRGIWSLLVDRNPLALAIIEKKAREGVMEQTGGHYPAPLRALELVLRAPRTPLRAGLVEEARALAELAVTPVCKSLVGLFQLSEEAKRTATLPDGSDVAPIDRAAVVGGGVMGGAIAGLFAEKGLDVRLGDLARAPLDAALVAHRARVAKAAKRRRLQPHEAQAAIDRLTVATDGSGFGQAQIVVEAVAERMDVKHAVLSDYAARVPADTILATNTSSLSVDAIAAGVPGPERVVGMHFFNPVHRMPLVEIIRGERTTDEVVARTAKLALRTGKTPVIVADVAGFLVNRLLGPYLDEAVRVLTAGVEPEKLERSLKDFGMPMGPLELLDEVGFDIAAHAAESLHAAYGDRMSSSDLLGRMLEKGFTGKKGGAGFYVYADDPKSGRPKRTGLNPELAKMLDKPAEAIVDLSPAGIVDQLVLAMVNEAVLCLEQDVTAGPRELDLATVFGMGFPPFHGGLLRYADLRGTRDVVAALRRIEAAPDVRARGGGAARFKPAATLLELAESGGRLHDRAVPGN